MVKNKVYLYATTTSNCNSLILYVCLHVYVKLMGSPTERLLNFSCQLMSIRVHLSTLKIAITSWFLDHLIESKIQLPLDFYFYASIFMILFKKHYTLPVQR